MRACVCVCLSLREKERERERERESVCVCVYICARKSCKQNVSTCSRCARAPYVRRIFEELEKLI